MCNWPNTPLPAGLKRTYRGAPQKRTALRDPKEKEGLAHAHVTMKAFGAGVSLTVPNRAGYPEVFGNLMIFPLWPKPTPASVAAGVAWPRAAWGSNDPMSTGRGDQP